MLKILKCSDKAINDEVSGPFKVLSKLFSLSIIKRPELALCCVKFLYKFFNGDKYSSDQIVSLLIEIKGLSEKNDKANGAGIYKHVNGA